MLTLDSDSYRSDEAARMATTTRSAGEWAQQLQNQSPGVGVERVAGVPARLFEEYAGAAVRHAWVEEIEPGQWFAEIAGFVGLWGEGSSADMARADLLASIQGWAELKAAAGAEIPVIDGFDINLRPAG